LANSDDDTVLKALIDIAENTAKYLRPGIDEVFNLCLEVSIICHFLFLYVFFLVSPYYIDNATKG
jgi:hypothetical protein